MATRVSRRAGWLLFFCLMLLPAAASADPVRIFESAKPGPSEDHLLGYSLFDGQFAGLTPVPDPGTLLPLGSGAAAILGRRLERSSR
jgi:hypothetical protein